jgi:hypothetical protein
MFSSSREGITEDFDALRAAVPRIVGHSYEALTTPERLALLERLEQETRRLPVPGHALINQLVQQASRVELGGRLSHVLADRLRITRAEANRRIEEAQDLGPLTALTDEALPPRLRATSAGQRSGTIGAGHIRVIRRFFDQLPSWVDAQTRESADRDLAKLAAGFRPEALGKVADRIARYLNPDGEFTDDDRARRRGLTLGKQDIDGMSPLRGRLTPEARATFEVVLAKLAAPGMCNPDDESSVIDGPPSDKSERRDIRSPAQRNHDGLNAALRALLASGRLGQHNGLPATIVVSTTLKELEAGAGKGLTGGGSLLPMSDVIRLARHAHHLAIFDEDKTLALYHAKRLASPAQRIMLYAKDRGCTRPGYDVPGYWSQVHHVEGWATTHRTDIDTLTLACESDHPLVEPGGWHISTMDSHEPIRSIIPKSSLRMATMPTTRRSGR